VEFGVGDVIAVLFKLMACQGRMVNDLAKHGQQRRHARQDHGRSIAREQGLEGSDQTAKKAFNFALSRIGPAPMSVVNRAVPVRWVGPADMNLLSPLIRCDQGFHPGW
jgi:hypothetical protein